MASEGPLWVEPGSTLRLSPKTGTCAAAQSSVLGFSMQPMARDAFYLMASVRYAMVSSFS